MKNILIVACFIFTFGFACKKTDESAPLPIKTEIKWPDVPGSVINHSPAKNKIYLGSPSICVLPNGDYIISHDLFGPNSEARVGGMPITKVYRSSDKGLTWVKQPDIIGQFMSNVFVHKNVLYIMGVSKVREHVVIRKSLDNGRSWTTPDDANTGLLKKGAHHTAPTPVVSHNGRLWRAMEGTDGPVDTWPKMFTQFMMSANENDDLLKASSWTSSNAMPYNSTYLNGYFYGWLEGNAVPGPDNKMLIVSRVHTFSKTIERTARLNVTDDGKTTSFNANTGFNLCPGGAKKFTIRKDPNSGRYISLSNYVPEAYKDSVITMNDIRNTLAVCSSTDLVNWRVDQVVLQHPDKVYHGFQYVDWVFEGNDILIASRTAFADGQGGAESAHNNNFVTFHRVANYKSMIK
jgi:hypothetical protein